MATNKTLDSRLEMLENTLRDESKNTFENTWADLGILHDDIHTLNGRIDKVDIQLSNNTQAISNNTQALEQLHQLLVAQFTNSRAARPTAKIQPMGILSSASPPGLSFPSLQRFPRTVEDFWSIDVEDLGYLCEFYSVTREDIVGEDLPYLETDEQDTSSSASSSPDTGRELRVAVRDNREKALSCLADPLGLDINNIIYNMRTVPRLREEQPARERGVKRGPVTETNSGSGQRKTCGKKQRIQETPQSQREMDEDSSSDDVQRPDTHLLTKRTKDELKRREPTEKSSPSMGGIVTWAGPSDIPSVAPRLRDITPTQRQQNAAAPSEDESKIVAPGKMGDCEEAKTSRQTSGTSTQVLTHTATPYKDAVNRRAAKQSPGASITTQR